MNEELDDTLKKVLSKSKEAAEKQKGSRNFGVDKNLQGDPNCPHCNGIGYVRQDLPVDHPDFGKLQICECRQEQLSIYNLQRLYSLSNLEELSHLTFDSFEPKGRLGIRKEEAESLITAFTFAKEFSQSLQGWLILIGSYGCGKTHLGAAIANEAVKNSTPTLFITVPDLLDWLRFAYDDPTTTFQDRFEEFRNIKLLILDDFGTENATEWAQEKIFQILNYRYINKFPTVITTNLNFNQFEERISSRLFDSDLVQQYRILAPDYRKSTHGINQHHELSALGELGKFTFNNITDFLPKNSSINNAMKGAKSFSKNPNGKWIAFEGPSNSGKTLLAASIANYCAENGFEPLFIGTPDLLDHLRATFNPKSTVSYDKLFNAVKNVRLLILDDLGTQSATPWAKEKLFQLFNHRYNADLAMVITVSNMEEFEATAPRIANRIKNKSNLIKLNGTVQKNSQGKEESPGYF